MDKRCNTNRSNDISYNYVDIGDYIFMKLYNIYALAIGFSLNLVFVITFYWMLIVCGEPRVILDANSFGEYWFEFVLLQVCLSLTAFTFFRETYNYYKRDEKK